jgi:hypothetical protein
MANITPKGEDQTTGVRRQLQAGDTIADSDGNPAKSALPPKYMQGLEVFHDLSLDADNVYVEPGNCRDRDDTKDLSLTSRLTLDHTVLHSSGTGLPQSNGMDEVGLDNLLSGAITCSQTSLTVTASASIISSTEGDGLFTPYLPTNIVNMSTVGTAFTGGQDIIRDVAVADLVGNSSKGWSRVVSVDSDTTLTLAAALPGGNATAEAWSIIHNVTYWAGTTALQGIRPDTLSADGTTLVAPAGFTQTVSGGSPLTLGLNVRYPGDAETIPLAVWITENGDGYLSTQHVHPLGIPSSVAKRHVGWTWYNGDDGIYQLFYTDGGYIRSAEWAFGTQLKTLSVTGSFAQVGPFVIPRTAQSARIHAEITNAHASSDGFMFFRKRGQGQGSGSLAFRHRSAIEALTTQTVPLEVQIDEAGYIDSFASGGTLTGTSALIGWTDNFGRATPTPA